MSRPAAVKGDQDSTAPELLERWRADRSRRGRSKDDPPASEPVKPVGVPPADRSQVTQAALSRYREDEVAAIQAARNRTRPKRTWDEHALLACGRFWFRAYAMLRSFIVYHLCGFVPAAVRFARLRECEGCSYRKDRGDGVMYCGQRRKLCGCPTYLPSCLFWLTRLRAFACPIGRFKAWSASDAKALALPVEKDGCGGCGK